MTKKGQQGRAWRYGRLRILVLLGAFLLILINPFLNAFYQINFVQGWYQSLAIGDLWFVSPLEGLERLLITRTVFMPSIIAMLIPVVLAFMLGRVFCSWICPISFFLEAADRLRNWLKRRGVRLLDVRVHKKVIWFTLIGELLISMVIGLPVFVFLSPPGLVGREIMMLVFFRTLALEGIILPLVIGLEIFSRRFFCRSFCPLGGLLACIGSGRKLRVVQDQEACTGCGRCNRGCPLGLRPEQGESLSAYCWNCGECVDLCRDQALKFRWLPLSR